MLRLKFTFEMMGTSLLKAAKFSFCLLLRSLSDSMCCLAASSLLGPRGPVPRDGRLPLDDGPAWTSKRINYVPSWGSCGVGWTYGESSDYLWSINGLYAALMLNRYENNWLRYMLITSNYITLFNSPLPLCLIFSIQDRIKPFSKI